MTISGREASGQQFEDGSAQLKEAALCAKLFCTTLVDLNAVAEQQMRGLLNLAVAAAEVANSLYSSKASAGSASERSNKELTDLASQIKSTADKISRTTGADVEGEQIHPSGADTFCQTVDRGLSTAALNSVSLQQQLNVLGQAILAEAATLLFSVAGASLNDAGQNR